MASQVTAVQAPTGSGFGGGVAAGDGSKVRADHIAEDTSGAGITFDHNVTFAGTGSQAFAGDVAVTGNTTLTGTATITGATAIAGVLSANGGINLTGVEPTCFHSGGVGVAAVATGTDKTAVNTETYIVEVFVPVNTTLTGVSILHLATSTGNVQISLANSAGTVIAAAQTASTAATGSAAFQQIPFAVAYAAIAGKYFILMQNSGSNHFRAHAIGNFGASKKTGETYGTFTNVTAPTTFTADLGPICDLY